MKELSVVFLFSTLSINCGPVHSALLELLSDALLDADTSSLQTIINPPTFTDLASQYGYPAQTHEVTTADGYILTVFRIPGNSTAPPVLLCHGILDSSDTWIIRGDASLSINLAKKDYDLWLMNVRGNKYSKRNLYLNPYVDPSFWNFTFNEIGLYDVPATIDYILNETGATKVNYIGHSQGTSAIFVLLSTRTEYNDKVNVATALAPIAFIKYMLPPFTTLVHITEALYPFLIKAGVTNVLSANSIASIAFRLIGQIPILGYLIDAYDILFEVFGSDPTELEPPFIPIVSLHVPTATPVKNLVHYSQLSWSGLFAMFDYGEEGNLAEYGSTTPPNYALGNITAKVVLLAALNDKLSRIADVDRLREELPNVVNYVINPRTIMNHLDYIWGRTAKDYLFGYIYAALEN